MSRDVMRVLAEARPAELDPDAPVDASTRAAELAAAMAAPAADPRAVPPRRRVRPLWHGGLGLAGAAAAAAAALVLTSLGGGQGDVVPDRRERPDATSARAVLLTAASKAEQAPATGKYWRVTRMYLIPIKVGPKERRYTVVEARINEEWADANGRGWFGYRTAGAAPRSPQDEKAWRLDGSPARWDLGRGDTVGGERLRVQVKPGKGTLVKSAGPNDLHVPIAGPDPTFDDLRRLPSDPAALRALAEKRALSDGDDIPLQADGPQARRAFAAGKLIDLLTTAPVPPKVRAAAFRALAGMPGVTSEGKAVDARGRKGVALSIVTRSRGGSTSARLIIDPATSQVLSERLAAQPAAKSGPGKERTTLYLGAGWTDETPRPPALP